MGYLLVAALLPAVVLIYYIYRKDGVRPEPTAQVITSFFLGWLAVPITLCVVFPMMALGLYSDEPTTLLGGVISSFLGAAIPEECAKLFLLWLFLRRNSHFDERLDGIVYAVCVSLGFAALENIFYLISNYEAWTSVAITRALFSVPGHMGFGVLMGYYYSLAAMGGADRRKARVMTLAAPILAHGIFNSLLYAVGVMPAISLLLTLLFIYFCYKLWKIGQAKIALHRAHDADAHDATARAATLSGEPTPES